jgi:hypothetical protein
MLNSSFYDKEKDSCFLMMEKVEMNDSLTEFVKELSSKSANK